MLTSTAIILTAIFLVVALLYSSVGHAGASGYLAAMALVGTNAATMKPTSLLLNVVVATIAAAQFARAGHFSWRLFWPFAVTSMPAAVIGGWMQLPAHLFGPLLGAMLLFSAWRLWPRASMAHRDGDAPPPAPPSLGAGLALGAVIGLVSGLSGTGGGIFLSPLILLCGWGTPRQTAAVSAVFILVNSAGALAGLLGRTGSLPDDVTRFIMPWAAAVVVGGVAGSHLGARRFPSPTLRQLLAVVLVVAGVKLVMAA